MDPEMQAELHIETVTKIFRLLFLLLIVMTFKIKEAVLPYDIGSEKRIYKLRAERGEIKKFPFCKSKLFSLFDFADYTF